MKFSIRDLLWLTLLVACCVLWWLDRGRLNRLQEVVAAREAEQRKISATVFQFLATTQAPSPGRVAAGFDPADQVSGGAGESGSAERTAD